MTVYGSWQAGWTDMGLGEDGAHPEMGGDWVPMYLDRVATQATPASLGGVKGKAEAAGCCRGELTTPGLGKDRAPKLQDKSSVSPASYWRSLRDWGKGEDCAVFIKSTYHFAPFFCSPTEAGVREAAPGAVRALPSSDTKESSSSPLPCFRAAQSSPHLP